MFDFPALDVAIGLIFLYVVLALVCSTANELIATATGLRAKFLHQGLLNLFSGAGEIRPVGEETAKAFYNHPLIQGLIRPGHNPEIQARRRQRPWRRPYPSYIPSRTFVAALTDMAAQTNAALEQVDPDEAQKAAARIRKAAKGFEESLAGIPNERLSDALLALYRTAGRDAVAFQHAAEQWFDDAMERVSGWYKRRVQLILLAIASVVVLSLNADSLTAAKTLWRDDAVRAAVVKQAEATSGTELDQEQLEKTVRELDLPLGWTLGFGDDPTEAPNDVLAWLAKVAGLLLTIGAVMLGAPFWFDLLSKVMRVRSTGAPPPASDSIRTGEGEQPRSGSQRRGSRARAAPSDADRS